MRSNPALGIGICIGLACFEIGGARAATSLWDHNGSTVYLMADGATREFRASSILFLQTVKGLPILGRLRDSGSLLVTPAPRAGCTVVSCSLCSLYPVAEDASSKCLDICQPLSESQ
jgi:hypothetical protein